MKWVLGSKNGLNKFSKYRFDFLSLVDYSLAPAKDNLPNSLTSMPIPWKFINRYNKFLYFLAQLTCLLQNGREISNLFILIQRTDVKYYK